MSGRHDPIADPLSPELRAKVDRAAQALATEIILSPEIVRQAVLADVPLRGIATRCSIPLQRVRRLLDSARLPGEIFRHSRKQGGWGRRLDVILNQGG